MRVHTAIQAVSQAQLVAATEEPITKPIFNSAIQSEWRAIQSIAIFKGLTGKFPNKCNPNTISEQQIKVRVPANPTIADIGRPKRIKEPGGL